MSFEVWVSILWPTTVVATAVLATLVGRRIRSPRGVEESVASETPVPPTAPDPRPPEVNEASVPWTEGAEGLEFGRRCIERLVQSVVDSLRQTSDPLTANLLDIRTSMAELVGQIHRHDHLIQTGHDLERVEALARDAKAAMEGVGQATLGSARVFEGHVQALRRAQDSILDTSAQIGDLAERINVLSINASIEAARAGAAGRGFKVIASEVKTLAHESSRFLQTIEAAVTDTTGLFAGIQADLETQKAQIHQYLARQGESFTEFRNEFSSQRHTFQDLIAAISHFLGQLNNQMTKISPVAQTQEIAVQELENLSLVVSDMLSRLASEAASSPTPPKVSPGVAETWAPVVRRRLTTSRELNHLGGVLIEVGANAESGPPAPTIELF